MIHYDLGNFGPMHVVIPCLMALQITSLINNHFIAAIFGYA